MKSGLIGVRKLKYRSLDELKQRVVRVSSFAALQKEVLDAVDPHFSGGFRLVTTRNELRGALGKYGILDLEFEAAAPLPASDCVNRNALYDLGFFDQTEREAGVELGNVSDPTCISSVLEHLEAQKTFLKVFLRCETDERAMQRLMSEARQDPDFEQSGLVDNTIARLVEEAEKRLPKDFVVDDACLTNSTYVWLHRHLWL